MTFCIHRISQSQLSVVPLPQPGAAVRACGSVHCLYMMWPSAKANVVPWLWRIGGTSYHVASLYLTKNAPNLKNSCVQKH